MPFYRFETLPQETISPHYSTAVGGTVTGEVIEVGKYAMAFRPLLTGTQIKVGRLHFGKGEGAVPHAHPQEQVMVVLSGRLQVILDGQTSDLGPGEGFLAPPNVRHQVQALEETEVL